MEKYKSYSDKLSKEQMQEIESKDWRGDIGRPQRSMPEYNLTTNRYRQGIPKPNVNDADSNDIDNKDNIIGPKK